MKTKDDFEKIIIGLLIELGEDEDNEELLKANKDTTLYGRHGVLSSIELVSLINDVEDTVNTQLDLQLILANEKAMSRKVSPFRSVKAFANYVEDLVKEES